jgi:hypothetical protein
MAPKPPSKTDKPKTGIDMQDFLKKAMDPSTLLDMADAGQYGNAVQKHTTKAKEFAKLGINENFNPVDHFLYRVCSPQPTGDYEQCVLPWMRRLFGLDFTFKYEALRRSAVQGNSAPAVTEQDLENTFNRLKLYTLAAADPYLRGALEYVDSQFGIWDTLTLALNPAYLVTDFLGITRGEKYQ